MKELTQAISRVADKKVGECEICNSKYWYGVCGCGWHGLANEADGGGGIADTGDYDDVYCPKCHEILEPGDHPTCAKLRELAEICWHEILATGRLLTGDYPSHLNPNCQGEWMLGDFYACECGFIGFDATSRSVESEGVWKEHAGNPNPTYTIQTLKTILSDLGEWDRFVGWNATQIQIVVDWMIPQYCLVDRAEIEDEAIADILTTDSLMAQAVESYLGTI